MPSTIRENPREGKSLAPFAVVSGFTICETRVKAVRPGQPFKEILVDPSGMERGLEDVLILIEGVHQRIPDSPSGMQPIYIAPAPAKNPPDAVRRLNQSGGTPPGGQLPR